MCYMFTVLQKNVQLVTKEAIVVLPGLKVM